MDLSNHDHIVDAVGPVIFEAFAQILADLPQGLSERKTHNVIGGLQVLAYYLCAEDELIAVVNSWRKGLLPVNPERLAKILDANLSEEPQFLPLSAQNGNISQLS